MQGYQGHLYMLPEKIPILTRVTLHTCCKGGPVCDINLVEHPLNVEM